MKANKGYDTHAAVKTTQITAPTFQTHDNKTTQNKAPTTRVPATKEADPGMQIAWEQLKEKRNFLYACRKAIEIQKIQNSDMLREYVKYLYRQEAFKWYLKYEPGKAREISPFNGPESAMASLFNWHVKYGELRDVSKHW
uniref:Uncharacterized protein n=1 Tax=viral metagenome TaxID=1070528 RepID=A0A6C0H7Z0_9ZZZZ